MAPVSLNFALVCTSGRRLYVLSPGSYVMSATSANLKYMPGVRHRCDGSSPGETARARRARAYVYCLLTYFHLYIALASTPSLTILPQALNRENDGRYICAGISVPTPRQWLKFPFPLPIVPWNWSMRYFIDQSRYYSHELLPRRR